MIYSQSTLIERTIAIHWSRCQDESYLETKIVFNAQKYH